MSYLTKKKSWFRSPIIAVILFVLVILAAISVARAFAKEREAAKLRDQYRREVSEMDQRQAELDAQIKNLSTDRGLESEIRNRYRVSKPGEDLVVEVNNGEDASAKTNLTWWQKVLRFVGL